MKTLKHLFSALILCIGVISCSEESKVTDPIMNMSYVIQNSLETPVTLKGNANSSDFNIVIENGEKYEYILDHWTGNVEGEKHAILSAKVLDIQISEIKTIRLYKGEKEGTSEKDILENHLHQTGKNEITLVIDQNFVDKF